MSAVPKTERGRASRERIVASADALIAKHGVGGTSLDEILDAAGASKSQLYHYFGDRDDLVRAVITHRCDTVLAEVLRSLERIDTLQALERWLSTQVALQRKVGFSGCALGSLVSELAEHDELARRQLSAAFQAWQRGFEAAVRRIQARGELRADAPPAALAAGLLACMEGGLLLAQTRKSAQPLRAALDAGLTYLRSFAPKA
jgi:AcrR family transcriptional regulator